MLDELGITYPQYLVLLSLWETDEQPVNDIAKRLYLQTNTITPLIKRLEHLEIVTRAKSDADERKVIISLSSKGKAMKNKASDIPFKLTEGMEISIDEMVKLKHQLDEMIKILA